MALSTQYLGMVRTCGLVPEAYLIHWEMQYIGICDVRARASTHMKVLLTSSKCLHLI